MNSSPPQYVEHSLCARIPINPAPPPEIIQTLVSYIAFYASLSSHYHDSLLSDVRSCFNSKTDDNDKYVNVMKILSGYLVSTKDSNDDNTLMFRLTLLKSSLSFFGVLAERGRREEGRRLLDDGWGEGGGVESRREKEVSFVCRLSGVIVFFVFVVLSSLFNNEAASLISVSVW